MLAALAIVGSLAGFYGFVSGDWWRQIFLTGSLQAGLAFLLFYGGSKLVNVVLDIEKNTRECQQGESDTPHEASPRP